MTLTIEDDVAAQIEILRREKEASLKDIVNDTLRRGLRDIAAPPKARKPFRTTVFDMGAPLVDIDNTAEILAYLDREDAK